MASASDLFSSIRDYEKQLTGVNETAVDAAVSTAGHGAAANKISKGTRPKIRAILKKLAEGDIDSNILEGLASAKLGDRIAATKMLFGLVAEKTISEGVFDPELLKLMIQDIGPEVLIITPGFADGFRRFLTGEGSRSEGRIDDFVDALAGSDDVFMRSALRAAAESRLARRLFGARAGSFKCADHFFRASRVSVEAAMTSLDAVRKSMGNDDIFFKILFAKIKRLVPGADEDALRAAIITFLSSGKLPERMSVAGRAKAFDTAARGGLHGMMGEILMIPEQIEQAKALAKAKGETVVLMLGVRVKAARTIAPSKQRGKLDKLVDKIDDPEWQEIVGDMETSVGARSLSSRVAEYSDGMTGQFHGEGAVSILKRDEGKVDGDGVNAGLKEFERNREDIEFIEELRVGQMVEVQKDGTVKFLSQTEAQELSGGEISGGEIVLREDQDVLKELIETNDTAAKSSVDGARNAKAHAKRKLRGAARAEKTLYVGKDQAAKFARMEGDAGVVQVQHYGHDYDTVADLAVWALAELGFKTK